MNCFCRLSVHLLAVSGILVTSIGQLAAQAPTYYASQGHYWPQPYQSISENRTLTGISGVFDSPDVERITTTGGFLRPFRPLVNESTAMIPGGHDKVLNTFFGGFRVTTTENGHTMLWVGTTNNVGRPLSSPAAVWKADGTFITYEPVMGASRLIPRDMNELLRMCGNIAIDKERATGVDEIKIPLIIKGGGGVSVIEPSRVARAGYGYETKPREGGGADIVTKDNGAVAMAINSRGAVVCDMYGSIYTEGFDRPKKEYWSFVSLNGSIVTAHLPRGATDINDHGDVVGYSPFLGTWLSIRFRFASGGKVNPTR